MPTVPDNDCPADRTGDDGNDGVPQGYPATGPPTEHAVEVQCRTVKTHQRVTPGLTGEEHPSNLLGVCRLSLEVHGLRSLGCPELQPRGEDATLTRAVGDSNPHHSNGSPTVHPIGLLPGPHLLVLWVPRCAFQHPFPRRPVFGVTLPILNDAEGISPHIRHRDALKPPPVSQSIRATVNPSARRRSISVELSNDLLARATSVL